jgi:hypothetical protein
MRVDSAEGAGTHADDHQATKIQKPFTAQTLFQAIRHALDTT